MYRHLIAYFHRSRCRRDILIPMLQKLDESEKEALFHLLREVESQAKATARPRFMR